MTRGDQVEVLANLDPGTKIVGRGATMLRDGDRISTGGGASKKSGGSKKGAGDDASSGA